MAKTFFTGGTMPSHDLLLYFQNDLKLQKKWAVNGTHYSKTLEAWLARFDIRIQEIWPILEKTYGIITTYLTTFHIDEFFKINFFFKVKKMLPNGM